MRENLFNSSVIIFGKLDNEKRAIHICYVRGFFPNCLENNDYYVNSSNRTRESKEADKVRQELNEKPLNHLWHRRLPPNAIAVSGAVKGDEVC